MEENKANIYTILSRRSSILSVETNVFCMHFFFIMTVDRLILLKTLDDPTEVNTQ